MLNTALICILMTAVAFRLRYNLPADDGTEYVRQLHLWLGFVAMGAIDALTILLIRWQGKCYPRLTRPLTVVLGCSILSHAYGAFLYAAGDARALAIYDWLVVAVSVAQILVFCWWCGSRNGRRDRRFHGRPSSARVLYRSVALRNNEHKAGPQ